MNFIDNTMAILGSMAKALRRGGRNGFSIGIGDKTAVLERRNEMFFSHGRPSFGDSFFSWRKAGGAVSVMPGLEPNPHMVISGMSGFGKSTLFKSMLSDIRKSGIACIIFDAHDEHSDLVRGMGGSVHEATYSGINILELDGASVSERIAELSRLLKEIYSLGYIQTTKLGECLWYTYRKAGARSRGDRTIRKAPTVRDLLDELNIFIGNSKTVGERNTLNHLRDRISLLNNSAFMGSSVGIKGLSSGLSSFSLGRMRSREAQLIYIGELLNRLYATMHDGAKHVPIKLYIMIDEAQFLVDESSGNAVIGRLIEEGRKYGVGVIIITHAASTLNRKIIANSSTFITFFAREPSETSYVSRIISGGSGAMMDPVRNRICSLRKGEAIMVSNAFRMPIVVKTREFTGVSENKELSEAEAASFLAVNARKPIERGSLRNMDNALDCLIRSGKADALDTDFENNKQHWVMWHNNSLSIEHEVWVARISAFLCSLGIDNRVIDNSNGPDIETFRNGKRIAIEYETGSKSESSTLRMMAGRAECYDRLIVVVNAGSVERYARILDGIAAVIIPSDQVGECLPGKLDA